jgi:hypothetical protein
MSMTTPSPYYATSTKVYPCSRGTGMPVGYHHFEASPNGVVVCQYCGTKA